MKVWLDVSACLRAMGGRMRGGNTVLDGVDYHFVSTWNDDEHADAFLDKYAARIVKSGRDIEHGVLTLYFSVRT